MHISAAFTSSLCFLAKQNSLKKKLSTFALYISLNDACIPDCLKKSDWWIWNYSLRLIYIHIMQLLQYIDGNLTTLNESSPHQRVKWCFAVCVLNFVTATDVAALRHTSDLSRWVHEFISYLMHSALWKHTGFLTLQIVFAMTLLGVSRVYSVVTGVFSLRPWCLYYQVSCLWS